MISVEKQQNMFLDIARNLKKEIEVYAIGGTAMMLLGLKDSTADIDLVFTKNEEREIFIEAAKKVGWLYYDSAIIYGERKNKPIMLKFGDARLDLFVNEVIDFSFSKTMQSRAKVIRQFDKNLILKIADVHDIILMKCATDRIKDIDDVRAIIENKKIDFDILINEAEIQLSFGKERAILELGTFLEKLQKIGIKIPKEILDKLWDLLEKQIKSKRER